MWEDPNGPLAREGVRGYKHVVIMRIIRHKHTRGFESINRIQPVIDAEMPERTVGPSGSVVPRAREGNGHSDTGITVHNMHEYSREFTG
jgi:hypothetical protein